MRRVMPKHEYAAWLTGFMPQVPSDGSSSWLPLAIITDRTDGKLAHLDGLHISRAWALDGMADGLPTTDSRVSAINAAARQQGNSGLSAVTGEHYEGGHWLGSFATYLVTRRGVKESQETGNQGLPSGGVVGKALSIPGLVAEGAWCEITEGEEGESEACE